MKALGESAENRKKQMSVMENSEFFFGNNLIAEFMGNRMNGGSGYYISGHNANFPSTNSISTSDLRYHECWEWIMPVVEKISSMGFQVQLLSWEILNRKPENGFRINKGNHIIAFNDNPDMKTAIWKSVVGFVKWHNSETAQ